MLFIIGLGISLLLLSLVLIHQTQIGWDQEIGFSAALLIIALFHLALYGFCILKAKRH